MTRYYGAEFAPEAAAMPGVITLLDPPNAARVEALWEGMSREFGVPRGYPGAIPHMSLHLSSHDVDPGAARIVERVARESTGFTVHSAGLGVFGGPVPVIHLMVARSPEAAALAARLEADLAAGGFPSTDPYFTPARWIPHVTIAHKNLAGIDLGPLLGWLARQPLAWDIPVTSLSVARETETSAEILVTFPFGKAAPQG